MRTSSSILAISAALLLFTSCKKDEVEDSRNKILPSFTYKESVNGEVLFSGKSENSISIESYTWTFGDGEGQSGSSSICSKTYKKNGIYEVKLEVKDRSGRKESVTSKVIVTKAPL